MSNKNVLIIQILPEKLVLGEYKNDKTDSAVEKLELAISADMLYQEAGKAAIELEKLLKEHNIQTTNTIIIPQAAEVLVRKISVPPLNDSSLLKNIIHSRLARELKISASEMTLDFCGEISGQNQSDILLAGLQRKREAILASMCESVGLNLTAIIPEFCWLYNGQVSAGVNENIIYVNDNSAGIAVVNKGSISEFTSVSCNAVDSERAVGRILAELGRNPVFNSGEQKFKVVAGSEIAVKLEVAAGGNMNFYGVSTAVKSGMDNIAELYFGGKDLPINFIHNHFTGKKKSKLSGRSRKAIIAAVGILALTGWFFADWNQDKIDTENAQMWIKGTQDQVKTSQGMINKINKARKWCNTSPFYSECLKEVTEAFPDSESIWTQSLALDEKMGGVITGISLSKSNIEKMLEGFIRNKHFSDVQTRYIRQAGKSTTELSFALQFTYTN